MKRRAQLGHSPVKHARNARAMSQAITQNATTASHYASQQKCSLAFKFYERAVELRGGMTANLYATGKNLRFERSRAAISLQRARRLLGDRCFHLGGR